MKKHNLIIFTGVDATGKSTIAGKVKKEFNLPLLHLDKVDNENEGKIINHYFMKCIDHDIILDRYYMEEVVYAPVYRGYKASYIREFEKEMLDKFNVILIYTTAETEVIKQRFNARGEDFTRPNDIEILKEHYLRFLDETLISNKFVVDTSKGLSKKEEEKLMGELRLCLN